MRRDPDPGDRRRVVISAIPGAFGQVFAGLSAAMGEVSARYSPQERQVIADWVIHTVTALKERTRLLDESAQVRRTTPPPAPGRP